MNSVEVPDFERLLMIYKTRRMSRTEIYPY